MTRAPRPRAVATAALALAAAAAALAPASASAQAAAGGGAMAARVQALEAEIRRLVGRIEELEFALRRAAQDGGLRLSDLDFRVTELEGGDLALVAPPTPLGDSANTAPAAGAGAVASERAALDGAVALLEGGDAPAALTALERLRAEATDEALTAEAEHWLGMAQWRLGATREAAQTFLANIVTYPQGPKAADSLLMLGRALAALGRPQEACDTLAEVGTRHPGAPAAAEAAAERATLACP